MQSNKSLVAAVFIIPLAATVLLRATAVPQGSPDLARKYYQTIASVLKFKDADTIFDSVLDDVPRYMGYSGLSAFDLEHVAPSLLMDAVNLGKSCDATPCETAVRDIAAFSKTFSVLPLRPGEILASRFLAPKIADMSQPADTRPLGWRKLLRLRARKESDATRHGISDAVILFNFFTKPGDKPFTPESESVNTQVMLLTARSAFSAQRDSIYWLDYGPLPDGKLSFELDAFFDASDLQGTGTKKPYYVPDGCVACHGDNPSRAMVNYLDTDHWFDRLDDDFARVRSEGLPVLFDGGNDFSGPEFSRAFDVIRQFNEQAADQAGMAQPRSPHRLAALTWLRLHRATSDHIPTIQRGVGTKMRWNANSANDKELLGLLNRYCFRCHGTINFNVFQKSEVYRLRAPMADRLRPTPEQLADHPDSWLMPPDRKIDVADRDRILKLLRAMGVK